MSIGSAVTLAVERVATSVAGMHNAVAGRWFSAIGPVGRPIEKVHDIAANAVYRSIRLAGAAVGTAADMAITNRSATTDRVQAVANGLWGDQLGRQEGRLGISMSLRDRNGSTVAPGPHLGTTFSDATGRLVFLVHGLADTERCWQASGPRPGLSDTLEAHPGVTPLSLRYNTGRRIATNGATLAELVESVRADWPVPVQSIALVGHSMGGLVIRSACGVAHERGHQWISDVTDIVTLGSPHLGSPLEKLANGMARGLSVARETRPLAEFVNSRSGGIKDLRSGVIAVADKRYSDAAGITEYFVAGVVTADPNHPFGILLGDLIVRTRSATAGQPIDLANVMVLGGVTHNDLVHEEKVIGRVMEWLALDGHRSTSTARKP